MTVNLRSVAHATAIVALAGGMPTAVSAQLLSGTATVADGDSLTVGAQRVRLFGIDAPELDQLCVTAGNSWQCGARAREQLGELVEGQRVDCRITGLDQYGRNLGTCSTEFLALNEAMVDLGWAVAYREYSLDYVDAEDRAKARTAGIWASTFTMPSQHRKASDPQTTAPSPGGAQTSAGRAAEQHTDYVSPDCRIKGNRNRKGQWIYHLPGMPYYDATRAEEFFCSEAQARSAGYRRAIVR